MGRTRFEANRDKGFYGHVVFQNSGRKTSQKVQQYKAETGAKALVDINRITKRIHKAYSLLSSTVAWHTFVW